MVISLILLIIGLVLVLFGLNYEVKTNGRIFLTFSGMALIVVGIIGIIFQDLIFKGIL